MTPETEAAMWSGDTDRLHRIAGCGCCCDEHFSENCPARQWFACCGQYSMTDADRESWVRHYERFHGMTEVQFYGY